jgi:hypothetical protein
MSPTGHEYSPRHGDRLLTTAPGRRESKFFSPLTPHASSLDVMSMAVTVAVVETALKNAMTKITAMTTSTRTIKPAQ